MQKHPTQAYTLTPDQRQRLVKAMAAALDASARITGAKYPLDLREIAPPTGARLSAQFTGATPGDWRGIPFLSPDCRL